MSEYLRAEHSELFGDRSSQKCMARTREFDTEAAVTVAMEAIRQTGYGGTSVRDLAEAMEIGSGSLYAAFGSKEGLYLAALDLYRRRYALPFIQILRAGGDARETIRAAFEPVIHVVPVRRHA
jgi:TetR/AcrR family transcriptional regulator, transcriptional repressor for nem operon